MMFRGQKPLGPTAVAEAALSFTLYLVSAAFALVTQASEGSVAIPERPKMNCCFS